MRNPLQEQLVRSIRERGPMPFAAFMQLALYHPKHGYYSSGSRRTGWHGDFVTSPELDPAFGALWAHAFASVWQAAGEPASFEVVEIGGGEGGFAAGVLTAVTGRFADALTYTLVERSREVQERQQERLQGLGKVAWSRSITEIARVAAGCFFANEVLDNLPVHLVQRVDGDLLEVCVEEDEGSLIRTLRPPSSPELGRFLDRCGVDLPEGHTYEVQLAAESVATRCASLLDRGAIVFIDYGQDAAALAAKSDGSMICYSSAGVDDRPLEHPGAKDITVHANWTAVSGALRRAQCEVAPPVRQRNVLKALGLDDLQDALRDEFDRLTAAGEGAAAVRALSRRQAVAALADPDGLGSLEVLIAHKGIPRPPLGF